MSKHLIILTFLHFLVLSNFAAAIFSWVDSVVVDSEAGLRLLWWQVLGSLAVFNGLGNIAIFNCFPDHLLFSARGYPAWLITWLLLLLVLVLRRLLRCLHVDVLSCCCRRWLWGMLCCSLILSMLASCMFSSSALVTLDADAEHDDQADKP